MIPKRLRRYAALAERWGAPRCGSDPYTDVDRVRDDPAAFAELQGLAEHWTDEDQEALDDWLEESDSKCRESGQFMFLMLLIDQLELIPEREPKSGLQEHIRNLNRHGPEATRYKRQWAARFLADYGVEAMEAIPDLRRALADEFPGVRVWAHAALARLEGNVESHTRAIREIQRDFGEQDRKMVGLMAKEALAYLDRGEAEHDFNTFISACMGNELHRVKALINRVNVNSRDKDGATPLSLAINARHSKIVKFLLENGADPNLCAYRGEPPLNGAAERRIGVGLLRMLIDAGADLNGRDEKGRTALFRAIELGNAENADYLRSRGASIG